MNSVKETVKYFRGPLNISIERNKNGSYNVSIYDPIKSVVEPSLLISEVAIDVFSLELIYLKIDENYDITGSYQSIHSNVRHSLNMIHDIAFTLRTVSEVINTVDSDECNYKEFIGWLLSKVHMTRKAAFIVRSRSMEHFFRYGLFAATKKLNNRIWS